MKERFCKKLVLEHVTGTNVFPCRMKCRLTGKYAFRLAKIHKDIDQILVEDECEAIRLVVEQNYMIRAASLPGDVKTIPPSFYRLGQRSISNYHMHQ